MARFATIFFLAGLAGFLMALSPRFARAADSAARAECGSIDSKILGHAVSYCVVTPPGYAASGATRYPTLYYLHGLFEHAQSWIDRGGQQVWEDLTSKGELGKFIVVLPDGGRSFYVNSFDGRERYEDFFIQEFVPAIDKKYPTLAERATRGITGSSMGGYGALHLGMRHPDIFGSASAHSAVLLPKLPSAVPTDGRWGFYAQILQEPFGSPLSEADWEANSPLTLAERPERFAGLKMYFDCGDHDRYGFEQGAQLLDKTLTAKGFPHEFYLRPGNHGWSYLNQYMQYSLRFHWQCFSQVESKLSSARAKGGKP